MIQRSFSFNVNLYIVYIYDDTSVIKSFAQLSLASFKGTTNLARSTARDKMLQNEIKPLSKNVALIKKFSIVKYFEDQSDKIIIEVILIYTFFLKL
jgi:hypothetical protein